MNLSSISENNGLAFLTNSDQKIYGVGISTGGSAEMRMVMNHPQRHVAATTIDTEGAQYAQNLIQQAGLQNQIDVKIEDVTKPLPYSESYFDFIYARLILHYLPKHDLQHALRELYRILKPLGNLFIVVRSISCLEAQGKNSTYDPQTYLTHYSVGDKSYSRYFHSEETIQNHLLEAGFKIKNISSYQEQLCSDFKRTQLASQIDELIEVLAYKI